MKKGTKVKVLVRAGTVKDSNDSRFSSVVEAGSLGTYEGKHPNKRLGKDWHFVRMGDNTLAPLHGSQFEED